MKKNVRMNRVSDLIHHRIAMALLQHSGDTRFKKVSVTAVQISPDLSYAKIFVTVLSDDSNEIKQIVKALNHASKFLRRELAKTAILRIIPELKFIFDEATARGFHLTNLIDEAYDKIQRDENEEDDSDSIQK